MGIKSAVTPLSVHWPFSTVTNKNIIIKKKTENLNFMRYSSRFFNFISFAYCDLLRLYLLWPLLKLVISWYLTLGRGYEMANYISE